jgi:hypothetical protein
MSEITAEGGGEISRSNGARPDMGSKIGRENEQGNKSYTFLCFTKSAVLNFHKLDRCLKEKQKYDKKERERVR